MADPITLLTTGFIGNITANALYDAGKWSLEKSRKWIEQQWFEPDAFRVIQREIKKAFQKAWWDVEKRYRSSGQWDRLSDDIQELISGRSKWLDKPEFQARLFPQIVSPVDYATQEGGLNALLPDRKEANDALFHHLAKIGILDGLPSGFDQLLHGYLLDGIIYYFVEDGIKSNEELRNVLFFQQLLGLQVGQSIDREQIGKILVALEQLKESSSWQSEVNKKLEDIKDAVKDESSKLQEQIIGVAGQIQQQSSSTKYWGVETEERVNNLISQYIKCFVGRDDEKGRLNEFIHSNSSGILLITAGAGFGKSALLASWLQELRKEDLYIAYHFFSSQTDRSLEKAYLSILIQVSRFFDVPFSISDRDEQGLRDNLYGLLSDNTLQHKKPIVIVLDGLDEAEKPFSPFLPQQLRKGVFLVASARSNPGEEHEYLKGWVEGSEKIQLDKLSEDIIAKWLENAGNGELAVFAKDESFTTKISEVTQGFPLYLAFLIDELVQRTHMGQDAFAVLSETPLGFQKYIEQQIDLIDQLELDEPIRNFLVLLAVVRGPISSADLKSKALLGLRDRDLRKIKNSWQATRWLRIVTESSDKVFFTFSHPLLADSFFEILGDEATQLAEILLNYCSQWQNHHSVYALKYYAEHLWLAKDSVKLITLVRNDDFYLEQYQYVPDEPDLPLFTIRLALKDALQKNDGVLLAEIMLRYQLIKFGMLFADDPLQTLRKGNKERAIRMSALHPSQKPVLWSLLLAWELAEQGKSKDAQFVLHKIMETKLQPLDWSDRELGAYLLAPVYSIQPLVADQLRVCLVPSSSELCTCLALFKQYKIAKEIAQNISGSDQAEILLEIARQQCLLGDKQEALATIKEAMRAVKKIAFADSLDQADIFITAASICVMAGAKQLASDLCAQSWLLIVSNKVKSKSARIRRKTAERKLDFFLKLAGMPIHANVDAAKFLRAASNTLGKLKTSGDYSVKALVLALLYKEWGKSKTARQLMARFFDDAAEEHQILWSEAASYSIALREIQSAFILTQRLSAYEVKALGNFFLEWGDQVALDEFISSIEPYNAQMPRIISSFHSAVLHEISVLQLRMGHADQARLSISQALALNSAYEIQKVRRNQNDVLGKIVKNQVQKGNVETAHKIARTIPDREIREKSLECIVSEIIKTGDLEYAEQIISQVFKVNIKNTMLSNMALWFARSRNNSQVIAILERIDDERQRADAHLKIVKFYAVEGADTAIEEILGRIDNEWHSEVLVYLAIAQARNGNPVAAENTLKLSDYYSKSNAFAEIVLAYARAGNYSALKNNLGLFDWLGVCKSLLDSEISSSALNNALKHYPSVSPRHKNDIKICREIFSLISHKRDDEALLNCLKIKDTELGYDILVWLAKRKGNSKNYPQAFDILGHVNMRHLLDYMVENSKDLNREIIDAGISTASKLAEQNGNSVYDIQQLIIALIKLGKTQDALVLDDRYHVTDEEESLLSIAAAFAEVGDREHFFQIIGSCNYGAETAYELCDYLTQLYPNQVHEIVNVILKMGNDVINIEDTLTPKLIQTSPNWR